MYPLTSTKRSYDELISVGFFLAALTTHYQVNMSLIKVTIIVSKALDLLKLKSKSIITP